MQNRAVHHTYSNHIIQTVTSSITVLILGSASAHEQFRVDAVMYDK